MKNVILITLDAFRKDNIGFYGNNRGLTPFIDSLCDTSLVFTKAQSTGPYTQASFPAILTSSYFLDHGKPKGLSTSRTLISEPLKSGGITTAAFHSNPYLCGYFGWNRSWDVFYDSMNDDPPPMIPYIRGDVINTKASNWLKWYVKNRGDKSLFMWIHYMDSHEPYVPEKKYIDMTKLDITLTKEGMYSLFENTLRKRDITDPNKLAVLRQLYDIHVREVDSYIEQLFATLGELGMLKDSAIFITSDHGDEFGEHGGLSHDDKLYSELIDVPLIVYGTGEKGTFNKVVSTLDIAPTIVKMFGLPAVDRFQGHPFLPSSEYLGNGVYGEAITQIKEGEGDINKDVYFYREQDLKIMYRANTDSWEMYDLNQDPHESQNIISSSSKAEEMKEKLIPRVRRWAKT